MEPMTLPPLALAYIGDAVMSLKVREYLLEKGINRPSDLQRQSTRYVSAKAQAMFISKLLEQNFLSEVEQDVFRRGRNAKSGTVPKNTDVLTYHYATGLETLWGYLYLKKDYDRLEQYWDKIRTMVGN